jgi:arylsulfatase A-like enzyme
LISFLACGEPGRDASTRPNVLLIVVDTLRADHLGLYGYQRATSPTLDALAAEAAVFDNHVASSAQTVPSTLSLLLSLHPAEHGFRHLGPGHFAQNRPRYPDELLFLQEVFRDAGYATGAFVGNPFLKQESGFAQGFDRFVFSEESGSVLTAAAIEWLGETRSLDRPVFLYLHYFDVHSPYEPPAPYRDRFEAPEDGRLVYRNGPIADMRPQDLAATRALYDGGIAFVDDLIGELLGELRALELWGDSAVAITSDHGEEFLDHGGLGHGTSVFGELVRVPLILRDPTRPDSGRRVERLTHHLDLAPTLLRLASIDPPETFRGGLLTASPPLAYAEDGRWLAVYSDDEKLIVDRDTGATQRFHLDDAFDQHPLGAAPSGSDFDSHLRWYAALARVVAEEADEAGPSWSDEELERLEALGYVR